MKIKVYSTGDACREARHMQALDGMARAVIKRESPGWWPNLVSLEYVPGFTSDAEDKPETYLKIICLLPRTEWNPGAILELAKKAQEDSPSPVLYYSPPETPGFRHTGGEQRDFVSSLMQRCLLRTDMKTLARDILIIPAHIWSHIKVGQKLSFSGHTIELKVGM